MAVVPFPTEMNSDDVSAAGFKPLKKSMTTAAPSSAYTSDEGLTCLPSKPYLNRGMSLEFNQETGEKQSSQTLWEGSTWVNPSALFI